MTVQSETARQDYLGNSVTTVFSVPFRFLADNQLRVLRTVIATGVTTELVLNSLGADGYSVTGAGKPAGGSITTVTAPAGPVPTPALAERLSILRNVPITQLIDYIANDAFPAESHESGLDKLTMILQQQGEVVERAVVLPAQSVGVSNELPGPVALNLLRWKADLSGLENAAPPQIATVADGAVVDATVSPIAGIQSTKLNFQQAGTGALPRSVQDKLRDTVSVKDYGAAGNGVADDTASIQSAITANPGKRILFPSGTYNITSTLTLSAGVELMGEGTISNGTRLQLATSAYNAPLMEATQRASVRSMSLLGNAASGATPLQALIHVNGVNDFTAEDMYFNGGYDHIKFSGTSFYNLLSNCRFETAINSYIRTNSATAAGVDLKVINCRGGNVGTQTYGCHFTGLGSIVMSDTIFSPGNMTGAGIFFDTLATSAGVQQFDNCVFEMSTASPGIYFKGATGSGNVHDCFFSNCYIAGQPSTRMDYVNGVFFDNCYFTGEAGGAAEDNALHAYIEVSNVSFNSCRFNVTSLPIRAETGITGISLSVLNCLYTGSLECVYLPNLTPSKIGYLNVQGGFLGSNIAPVSLASPADVKKDIRTFGYTHGPVQDVVFVGTLNGSGAATVAHSITSGAARVLDAKWFYKGGSGEAVPGAAPIVDGSNVYLTGGSASAKYRLRVQFLLAVDANW